MKTFNLFVIMITLLFVSTSFTQDDKDNNLFEQIWDAGMNTIRRCWEIEGDFDLDQDGKKEFVAYDADQKRGYLFESHGNGDNQYDIIWSQEYSYCGPERSIFISDLDNDGFQELILAIDSGYPGGFGGQNSFKIYEWDGTDNGIPNEPTLEFDPPRNPAKDMKLEATSRLLNMDSDPEPEFVLTYNGGGGLYIAILSLENSDLTNPIWKVEYKDTTVSEQVHGAGIGDLNNDGFLDILASSSGTPGSFQVYTNTGENSYERVARWEQGSFPSWYEGCQSTIVITDINGDDKNEAFIFGQLGAIYVIHDVEDLTTIFDESHFTELLVLFDDANYRGGVRGDLDNDGYPDLYFAGNESNTILDLEWKGTADDDITDPNNYEVYVLWQDLTDKAETVQTVIGDFDGDGMNHGDLVFSISPSVAGFSGIMMLEYDPVTEISVVPISIPKVIPETCKLYSNYPNPFNPETKIVYDLAYAADVQLEIYNLLGQKQATLVNEYQGIGQYEVIFNGENEKGELLSSGIYIYSLKAKDFMFTKKMLYVK